METILGKNLFYKEVEVLKTNRGSEFIDADGFEKEEDGSRRTCVFYINSQSKENLKAKSPLEMMEFLNSELYKRFIEYGIEKIERDQIVLKPYLLKDKK